MLFYWPWHSRLSRFEHSQHFVRLPVCDPSRDTQWTRNRSAVLAFIGGRDVEYLCSRGCISLNTANFQNENVLSDAFSIFHQFPCRVRESR